MRGIDRNYNIDIAKFFCVIAVVLIHITAITTTKGITTTLNYYSYRYFFDIAVPFFFAASGFFISTKSEISYIKSYAKKILPMYVVFSLLFIIVKVVYIFTDRIVLGNPFWSSLKTLLKTLTIANFLKGTIGSPHLWYLAALFIASLLLILCVHFKLNARTIVLLSLLFYLASKMDLFGLSAIIVYGGFPKGLFYLSLGYYVGAENIKINKPILLFILSMVAYAVVRIIYPSDVTELLLAFATMCLLIICLKTNGKPTIISKIGGQYTLGIYIIHPLVYQSIYRVFNYVGYYNFYLDVSSYILITVISIVISIVLYRPVNKLFVEPLSRIIKEVI